MNLWNREPALIMGLVEAALALFLAFGLNLSAEQVAAIVAFSAALLSVIVRQKVSPVRGDQ